MGGTVRLMNGGANPDLGFAISAELNVPPVAYALDRFPDGEVSARLDEPLRLREVFIVQPTSPPVNDNLVELLALADLCRRASATRITAVVPYFGYARSDKRNGRREPIMASVVAQLMQTVGIEHVITVDLHSPEIEGFFQIPVENIGATPPLCEVLIGQLPPDCVVVSPDAGRVKMAGEYASRLGLPLTVLHKRRDSATDTVITHVAGDVRGKRCLIVDDMISTGGTIVASARALLEAGAHPDLFVSATHGLFCGGAIEKLERAGVKRIFVTDTIPQRHESAMVEVVTMAPILAEAIYQVMQPMSFQPVSF